VSSKITICPAGIKSPACPSIKKIFKMGVKKKDYVKREFRRIINCASAGCSEHGIE
jgi:hypothetical protein